MSELDLEAAATRPSSIASARSALFSVLGEFVAQYRQPVRTAALLEAITGLGFGEPASRQAIARAGASGLIEAEREGRETKWALTEQAFRLFSEGATRVLADNAEPDEWDGRWLILIAPIPESHRAVRKKLYAALRWAGFGNPSPGLWVTPHVSRQAEAATAIDALRLTANTFSFIGSPAQVGVPDSDLVQKSWDLDKIEDSYAELLARFDGRTPAPGQEALVAHLELVDALRHTPYMDPHLPAVLLPDWAGLDAARRLQDLREEWGPAAHAYWLEIARFG